MTSADIDGSNNMTYTAPRKNLKQKQADESSPQSSPRGRIASRNPATPPRGQFGRVPLHRRGTSRTYERLEDLLKEAGYKETKINTPETERTSSHTNDRSGLGGMRSGVGAVVDFISGWIPGSSSQSEQQDVPTRGRANAPSPSPVPSSRASGLSSRASGLSSRTSGLSDSSYYRGLRPRSSATDSLRAYAQRAAAQGHLRHMASTPNIGKRNGPSSGGRRYSTSRNTEEHPPMPVNWLNSVSKAVAGSSAHGAHVGGPTSRHIPIRSSRSAVNGSPKGKHALVDPPLAPFEYYVALRPHLARPRARVTDSHIKTTHGHEMCGNLKGRNHRVPRTACRRYPARSWRTMFGMHNGSTAGAFRRVPTTTTSTATTMTKANWTLHAC
ncbi:hypothetical protein NM688_g1027 [Phlebia brevispora]|uniref:Uncharacterized protein n=1 Tax=Phlebia brevispora TaxID=194682 RepID=A0ACC1TD06_9APHY|nr:hypothetical protein NM688_g1027 [Phlebia brevispora]